MYEKIFKNIRTPSLSGPRPHCLCLYIKVFARKNVDAFVGAAPDMKTLKQILLERFLREADDGWVMRATLTYRGALQAEDEEAGGERVLAAILADPQWSRDDRWYLLRETVRLVPREIPSGSGGPHLP